MDLYWVLRFAQDFATPTVFGIDELYQVIRGTLTHARSNW